MRKSSKKSTVKRFPKIECPKCEKKMHAESKRCDCGFILQKDRKPVEKPVKRRVKRKKKAEPEEIDWRELKKGDIIKIVSKDQWIGRTGPVFMGNNGKFKVFRLDENGIVLYNDEGFAYQVMIFDKPSKCGIERSQPKIYRINNNENKDRS